MKADIETDVLIIGGGPAGSTAALRLLDMGVRPVLVEREHFPRFHIGESMTAELAAIVRELGFEEDMAAAGHPVKLGVRVFGSRGNGDWWVPIMRRTEDLQLHETSAYHVKRSIFDKMLLDAAISRGLEVVDGRAIDPIIGDDGTTVVGARVAVNGVDKSIDIHAELTLDCSGQATFLANRKVTGPKYLGSYDKQIALFSQVANYIRDDGSSRQSWPTNTHIYYQKKYHWAWAIPLDAEVTSVGVVVPAQTFRDSGLSKHDFICRQLKELNSNLADRIPEPVLVEDAHVIPNYSFQVRKFAGPGYICIGDAHRFVDPIFSFGMYVAAKEASLAAEEALSWLEGNGRDSDNPFDAYMRHTESAIDMLEDMIDTFWENPLAFAVFAHDRYRHQVLDMFSGRIYHGQPVEDRDRALVAFRKLLNRERDYDNDALLSVPIGSRFHPERAPLWNSELDSVETTEAWLRDAG